jgi:sugar/nucleoside kinase (ribokinase family)
MSRTGIVLAGTMILDIVHIVERWPEEETVTLIQRTEFGAGGPPHNAAAGLKKLGAPFPVTLTGALGDDAYGAKFIELAAALGLDVSKLKPKRGGVTSHTHVMSSAATGKRTFFAQTGVGATVEYEDFLPADDSARFFYAGSPGITAAMDANDGWPKLMAAARSHGFKTCLELVPLSADVLRATVPACLPHCDIVVVNDHEAGAVTGMTLAAGERLDFAAAREACQRLLRMGVGELAAVHHPDGAVALTASGEFAAGGSVRVPAGEIAGTTGAGDAFFAGVLFGLHEGWPLERCLDLGNASAATSLHAATTSSSIRPWQECLAYAERLGLREIPPL